MRRNIPQIPEKDSTSKHLCLKRKYEREMHHNNRFHIVPGNDTGAVLLQYKHCTRATRAWFG